MNRGRSLSPNVGLQNKKVVGSLLNFSSGLFAWTSYFSACVAFLCVSVKHAYSVNLKLYNCRLLLRVPPKAGSGFTGGAVGKNPRSLQHSLSAGCLLGHIVVESPQTFLDTQYVGSYVVSGSAF